jgi:hypothetical protein
MWRYRIMRYFGFPPKKSPRFDLSNSFRNRIEKNGPRCDIGRNILIGMCQYGHVSGIRSGPDTVYLMMMETHELD